MLERLKWLRDVIAGRSRAIAAWLWSPLHKPWSLFRRGIGVRPAPKEASLFWCGVYIVSLLLAYWLAAALVGPAPELRGRIATVLIVLALLSQILERAFEAVAPFLKLLFPRSAIQANDLGTKADMALLVAALTTLVSVAVCAYWGLFLLHGSGWDTPSNGLDAFMSGLALSAGGKLLHAVADITKSMQTNPPPGGQEQR